MSEIRPPEETQGVVKDIVIKAFDPWLESKKHSNRLMIFFLLLVSIPIIGIGLATTRTILPRDLLELPEQVPAALSALPSSIQQIAIPFIPTASSITAIFTCAKGKTVRAVFGGSAVDLTLSDGRHVTLPQARSADGARYANPDESFVFWNVGNTAFIEENGTTTYTNCVTKS